MIESDNIAALKQSISDELRQLGIQYFSFNSLNPPSPPYAVSSAPSNDEDNMDASLLMSSGYIQPLLPSELGIVINLLFDRDNIARMRHMSAKKVVHSRAALQFLTKTPLILGSATETAQTNSSFGVSQTLTSNAVQPPIHAHLQVAEYTRREEKLAQIRLAKWANDLRRTMRDERVHFETLQQAERTTWLSQKLEECNQDAASPTAKNMVRCELASHASPFGLTHANDPLGLLRFDGYLRRHGLRIFQVVGTFGAFGAVALWVARNWSSCSDWSWTWGECRTWAC